jgi:hypothetical protein
MVLSVSPCQTQLLPFAFRRDQPATFRPALLKSGPLLYRYLSRPPALTAGPPRGPKTDNLVSFSTSITAW